MSNEDGPPLLLPPAEVARLKLEILREIFVAGMVEGEPMVDPAIADALAEAMIAACITPDAVERVSTLAQDRQMVMAALETSVDRMRSAIRRGDTDRLGREAQAYAAAFRKTSVGRPLPPLQKPAE